MDLLSLHQLFLDAGLKINGINSDGIISWIGTPAEKDLTAAGRIITDNPISETDVAPIASVTGCKGEKVSAMKLESLAEIVEALAIRAGIAGADGLIK